jgi:SsrA-binding protein
MADKNERPIKVVAENRKARFNYAVEDTVEAGIALTGTEVKSIRNGKTTIAESYADPKDGEIWLINANIPEYLQANRFNHEPKRPRKLLLHRKQINKLMGAVERQGMTLVPLKMYFNERGRVKLQLALAKGKQLHDKRDTEKKRDWSREKGRILRARGSGANIRQLRNRRWPNRTCLMSTGARFPHRPMMARRHISRVWPSLRSLWWRPMIPR